MPPEEAIILPHPSALSLTELEALVGEGEVGPAFLRALERDPRKGARALASRVNARRAALRREQERLASLEIPEAAIRKEGYRRIAGSDEAGRGALAGPVVAAVVILPEDLTLSGLDDSKRLDQAARESLFEEITARALAVGVGQSSPQEIDRRNVVRATEQAVRRALGEITPPPDFLLLDGPPIMRFALPTRAVVGGDRCCRAIAAASIVAKVTRDRLMEELAGAHPVYGWDRNKGYGTAEHWQALEANGPSPLHRRRFLRKLDQWDLEL